VIVPDSSKEEPANNGHKAHTNHLIFVKSGSTGGSPAGETPASLGCVYGVAPHTTGCPVQYGYSPALNPTGGSQTIAIVDAYDYPTAASDLATFSSTFGLPPATFTRVYATGSRPRVNCGWAQETALDIEWAHAMAPNAKIVLVEAASSTNADLYKAVDVATSEVICGDTTCPGGGSGQGEVSMSWGSKEFSSETSYDSHFTSPNVVYFAASGDTGGVTEYPSASPYVVAAGGTTVNRDSTHNFVTEIAWSGSGGGPSLVEPLPAYQTFVTSLVAASPQRRGIPDFSFDANPSSGVSVYDSTSCNGVSGWLVLGGTSVASPALAGIVNQAGHFYPGTGGVGGELDTIYSCYATSSCWGSDFHGVSASAGSFKTSPSWDFFTGVGSNQGLAGK
jgi:subtilase family serine protease